LRFSQVDYALISGGNRLTAESQEIVKPPAANMKTSILFEKTGRWLRNRATGAVWWLVAAQTATLAWSQAANPTGYTFVTVAERAVVEGSGEQFAPARQVKPDSLAVDSAGNVYFTDAHHQVICRLSAPGSVTLLAGKWDSIGSADGQGSEARFRYPHGIAVDAAGDLYVTDSGNDSIRRITPAGVVTTLAGMAGAPGHVDGAGNAARFNYPSDLAVDASGTLYVADAYNYVIRKVTPGGWVTTLAGQVGNSGGKDGAASEAEFDLPLGLAADDRGNIYVADLSRNSIRKITSTGQVITLAGKLCYQPGHADGQGNSARFFHPCGLAADHAGNVYVADSDNHLIRRIAPDGTVTTLAGLAGQAGHADGAGFMARFGHPFRIALDGQRNLYVTDLDSWAIRKGICAPAPDGSFTLTEK
jgi:sugar lactone lactonase YvrE